jgi:Ca2+-binding RTX toxin-like protein
MPLFTLSGSTLSLPQSAGTTPASTRRRAMISRTTTYRGRLTLLVAGLTVTALINPGAAGTAHAAAGSAYIDSNPFTPTLSYVPDGADQVNKVTVSPAGPDRYVIDDIVPIEPGQGCAATPGDATKVTCTGLVRRIIVRLGAGNDTVTNSVVAGAELYGGAGDDVLNAGPIGNDIFAHSYLIGGAGEDRLNGGPDKDTLIGGLGADRMSGGGGFDTVSYSDRTTHVTADLNGAADDGAPGEGDAILTNVEDLEGGWGPDVLTGDVGNNYLSGLGGSDLLVGLRGIDTLHGDDGVDYLDGGDERDLLFGDDGDDVLLGKAGDDDLFGDAGDDYLEGGLDRDRYLGGPGRDRCKPDGDDSDILECEVIVVGTVRDQPAVPRAAAGRRSAA